VAHRGAATRAPEHTIPAYEAAAAAGADALWLDLRVSADEQLVVFHDARLERTTDGRGWVRERSVRELKRLDAGRWFGRRFRGQRIQTLAEVLERFRGRLGFVVALPGERDGAPGVEERLLGLIQLSQPGPDVLVVAGDAEALARCRALDWEIGLGMLVVGAPPDDPAGLAPPGVLTALCLDAAVARETDVAACRAAGLECYLGVVPGVAEARRLAAWSPTALVMRAEFDAWRAPG
jgi:glycerophosphoryl diester phosphodiesterase